MDRRQRTAGAAIALLAASLVALPGRASGQQSSNGDCSPVVSAGDAAVINVKVECGLTQARLYDVAKDNLSIVLEKLQALAAAKDELFFPAVTDYYNDPSPAAWETVRHQGALINSYVDAASQSYIVYKTSAQGAEIGDIGNVGKILNSRLRLVASLPEEPMPKADLNQWIENYQRVAGQLADQIASVREKLLAHPPKPGNG
jgi:hypothetical protein